MKLSSLLLSLLCLVLSSCGTATSLLKIPLRTLESAGRVINLGAVTSDIEQNTNQLKQNTIEEKE